MGDKRLLPCRLCGCDEITIFRDTPETVGYAEAGPYLSHPHVSADGTREFDCRIHIGGYFGSEEEAVEYWNENFGQKPKQNSPAEDVLDYILQDRTRVDGQYRIVDIALWAFQRSRENNPDDGGPTDWYNDTYPQVMKTLEGIQKRYQTEKEKCVACEGHGCVATAQKDDRGEPVEVACPEC